MDKDKLKILTSPCGLPCFHCSAYLAKESPEILKKLVAALGVPPEKAICEGCRIQKGKIPLLKPEKTCEILLCTQEKGIEFCHECDNFPCERFQPDLRWK